MDLQDYARLVRKRWRSVAAWILAGILAATVVTSLTPRTYTSTAQLFVSTSGGESTTDLAQGSTFTQKQMKTYAQVMTSPLVLEPVRKKWRASSTAGLAQSITATTPPDTVLLNVTVTDRRPERAAAVANDIAQQFTTVVPELQSVKAGQASPVKATIVAPAAVADSPTAPQPLRNLLLGLVGGLLLGLAQALLRERLDTSVHTQQDLADVTEGTVIGAIPFDRNASSSPLVVRTDPLGSRSEAFRSLRTNLQFVEAARASTVMVITSSVEGEGKSTCVANLALTLGASGVRTCVIEADLRRPKLLSYLGLEGGVGLTDVLIGEAEVDDVLQPCGDGVEALGAGPIPPNPSELLGSARMRELIDQLHKRFDVILIDAPPLLPVTDAAVVGRLADGAVLIVGAGVVSKENVSRAVQALDNVDVPLLGLVLNRAPVKGHGGYAYYGDRYGYRAGEAEKHAAGTLDEDRSAMAVLLGSDDDVVATETAPQRGAHRALEPVEKLG